MKKITMQKKRRGTRKCNSGGNFNNNSLGEWRSTGNFHGDCMRSVHIARGVIKPGSMGQERNQCLNPCYLWPVGIAMCSKEERNGHHKFQGEV